ncbi:hypothetical protein C1637_04130 [Chryseobacterium lactis]|uniref:Secretion system C-terminal sorting domain-containing protein n=1 Tax=Chryseobacterium lactis TaxID=1241981 RepID=A0A3G6RTZ5_CHRLC|nr:hypothetical protein [Chryseobacterium lactis]AZA81771.1 hypothetical protein EG342_07520 [Chryseobacterium lactis]AZB06769.1 hypothetical protein EG341_23640 [Chryseobacterium lactis]PNW15621.1 hypothetical protein C1637_04130 [Chryseobacterium lactis]
MKRKIVSVVSLLIGFLGYSQTEVYFKYDEAGNQKYRGTNSAGKKAEELTPKEVNLGEQAKTAAITQQTPVMDEKEFWKQVRLYPIPVNDFLTIDWKEEVDGLIESVSLYQHSTVHWKFQQQNAPDLGRQVKINMTGYDWGVYILRFTLKDGRVFGRNVTKR